MLSTCLGLPLKKGAGIIAIVNMFASTCYSVYFIWEYLNNYGYNSLEDLSNLLSVYTPVLSDMFFNYITLIFLLIGFTSIFASFGLKQSTVKNETHKIYLWLVFHYVQVGTIICLEGVVLTMHTTAIHHIIILIICFILIDAVLVFQLLVVQPFYAEEKLIEETNYIRLSSELTSEQIDQQDEFQNVEF